MRCAQGWKLKRHAIVVRGFSIKSTCTTAGNTRVEHELKDAVAKLQRARNEQCRAEAVATAMEEVKA